MRAAKRGLHHERALRGDNTNDRDAPKTRFVPGEGAALLEDAGSDSDKPDVSAGGMCLRNIAGAARIGGADGEPATDTQHPPS
jgi:hypothetical protein